jgi:hypothetical protein
MSIFHSRADDADSPNLLLTNPDAIIFDPTHFSLNLATKRSSIQIQKNAKVGMPAAT